MSRLGYHFPLNSEIGIDTECELLSILTSGGIRGKDKMPAPEVILVQQDFLERLKNIGATWKTTPEKAFRAEQELLSEFLSRGEEALEPVAQVLADPSSSDHSIHLALGMVRLSLDPRFIPHLVQLLERADDEGLCEGAAGVLGDYGEAATGRITEALEEGFKQRKYNGWLVDALSGSGARDFVERILKDFLSDPKRYERWFDLAHFAWKLDGAGEKERSLGLVGELLKLKELGRWEKVWLRRLERCLSDREKYEEEAEKEESEKKTQLAVLVVLGVIHSPISDLAPDGPRPIIDDNTREEYLPLLLRIEEFIFEYYRDHPSLKDGDVMVRLKNVRDGLWNVEEWKDEFERELVTRLKVALFNLRDLRYTKGEVSACISHVLNSVKRHREEGYERAYLDFVSDVFERRLTNERREEREL
jgi:hypothetical protein